MLNEFRSTLITWDKATSRIYSPVTANESDENGRKLVVQIVNGGQVEDLTGASLNLYWITIDKAHDGLDVFKAVDLKKGEFELSYTTGMLSNKGVLNANLVLIDTVGRVVSERFKITVTEGIDNDAIQSENSFSSLTQALIDISNLETNYAPRLNDLTAQLQHIPTLAETLVTTNKTRFIAHRGSSSIAPENTIPAYERAAEMGFWGGETDVLITADGEWVVIHDDTVDRTTNGTGNVKDLTLAQIKSFKIDAGANVDMFPNLRVPTLSEFLETCKKVGLVPVIEIKFTATPRAADYNSFVANIQKYGFEEKCIVISFSLTQLQEVRLRSKKIVLQYLAPVSDAVIEQVKSLGNAGFDLNSGDVSKVNVEKAHANGLHVNCYTINTYSAVKNLINMGVDMITSDMIAGETL